MREITHTVTQTPQMFTVQCKVTEGHKTRSTKHETRINSKRQEIRDSAQLKIRITLQTMESPHRVYIFLKIARRSCLIAHFMSGGDVKEKIPILRSPLGAKPVPAAPSSAAALEEWSGIRGSLCLRFRGP